MRSVKAKVVLVVVCCIVLSSLAVGGASIVNARRAVTEDSSQIMNLLCQNRAEELDGLFLQIEQSVKTLTEYAASRVGDLERFRTDPAYVEEYTAGLLALAVNAARNTSGALTVYIRYNPAFTAPTSGLFCSRSSATGSFTSLEPTDLSLYGPDDTEHVGWFYEPVKNRDGTWMAPYYNDNIQVEMISYVIPYYRDGTLIGVVGMDIDFAVLRNVISQTEIYQSGYAFLTDPAARIVYHQSLPRGTDLTAYNLGEFHAMAQNLRENESSGTRLLPYDYVGQPKQAAFRSLVNGMRLVLTAPQSEIDAQASKLILQISLAVAVIIVVAVVVTLFFTRRMVKPLEELTVAARCIAAGDLSVEITHHSKDEVGALAESFRQTVSHLHQYISYINELAYRDSLTGVRNRTAYLEIADRMDEAMRLKRPNFALMVLDINGLKHVNDTRGHDFGDIMIIEACKILCRVFAKSPVYRIGGDEFVVLLEDSDLDRYVELLTQLEGALRAYNDDPQNDLQLSIARGVAVYQERTDLTFGDVFKRADGAMYRNKLEMKRQNPLL